jgi:hypothetical protein
MTNYPTKFFKDMYLDYVNNYATIELLAEHNNWSVEEARAIIALGREKHTQNTDITPKKERFEHLMERYRDLKDELLSYTEDFHDAMLFDIEGFAEERTIDAELIDTLETQVNAFEHILRGYEQLDYTYS